MLPGFEERVITVVTPAAVARRAATILVDMPPVPKAEPALDTGPVVSLDLRMIILDRTYHRPVEPQCLPQPQLP